MKRSAWDVILVGGGIAAVSAAESLIQSTPPKKVLLLNGEDRLPYKRTKISKTMAAGFSRDQWELRSADWYSTEQISVINARAESIDPQAHALVLDSGKRLHWRICILATGAEPKRPEVNQALQHNPDLFVLRRAKDVELLRSAVMALLPTKASVLVIGLGVLGVEAAEQLRKLGAEVTAVEAGAAPMQRELNQYGSAFLGEVLESLGITLFFNEEISIDPTNPGFRVELKEKVLNPQFIVFCAGTDPAVELARTAGINTDRGILVDEYLRTSHPDIYAAGDNAQHPGGETTHLWHAAEHQGSLAGFNAGGAHLKYDNRPFRLKTEIGGHYFFSMGRTKGSDQILENHHDGLYQYFVFSRNRCTGVVMIDDKTRSERYVQAVHEAWTRQKIEREFSNV